MLIYAHIPLNVYRPRQIYTKKTRKRNLSNRNFLSPIIGCPKICPIILSFFRQSYSLNSIEPKGKNEGGVKKWCQNTKIKK